MTLFNVPHHGVELGDLILVHLIRVIDTVHTLISGDSNHAQFVGTHELGGLSLCGTGHACELIVHAEVVLQGHRGHCLVLGLNLDALFGLNRLVDTVVITAARQDTAGVLIHDQHLTVHHHIVLIVGEQLFCLN